MCRWINWVRCQTIVNMYATRLEYFGRHLPPPINYILMTSIATYHCYCCHLAQFYDTFTDAHTHKTERSVSTTAERWFNFFSPHIEYLKYHSYPIKCHQLMHRRVNFISPNRWWFKIIYRFNAESQHHLVTLNVLVQ